MNLSRRGFLGALLGGAAIAADPERLLWTPGQKLISIPSRVEELYCAVDFDATGSSGLPFEELERCYIRPAVVALQDRIARDILRHCRKVEYQSQELPRAIELAVTGPMGRLPQARALVGWHPVKGVMIGRVDARVRAYDSGWTAPHRRFA